VTSLRQHEGRARSSDQTVRLGWRTNLGPPAMTYLSCRDKNKTIARTSDARRRARRRSTRSPRLSRDDGFESIERDTSRKFAGPITSSDHAGASCIHSVASQKRGSTIRMSDADPGPHRHRDPGARMGIPMCYCHHACCHRHRPALPPPPPESLRADHRRHNRRFASRCAISERPTTRANNGIKMRMLEIARRNRIGELIARKVKKR